MRLRARFGADAHFFQTAVLCGLQTQECLSGLRICENDVCECGFVCSQVIVEKLTIATHNPPIALHKHKSGTTHPKASCSRFMRVRHTDCQSESVIKKNETQTQKPNAKITRAARGRGKIAKKITAYAQASDDGGSKRFMVPAFPCTCVRLCVCVYVFVWVCVVDATACAGGGKKRCSTRQKSAA